MITFNLDKDKNNWQIKSLGELLTSLESGGRATGGSVSYGIPSIGAEHLDDFGKLNFSSMKYVPKDYYYSMNKGKIFKGDILVVKDGATTGKVSFIDNDFPFPESAVNEHVFIVRTNKHLLDPQFAFYYLYSSIGKLQILTDFRGSAQGGISRGFVDKVHLPLPPLSIQKQIAEILEKVDTAKQKRQEANKLTVEFLQSVFIEMFGDPVKNPKRWTVKKFGDIFSSIRYGTGSPPAYVERGIPFIRATNIKNNTIVRKDLVFITREEATKIKKCELKEGNLIVVRSGVNTGDAAVVSKEFDGTYAAYDLIIELEITQSVFYSFLINSKYGKAIIEPLSRRAGQPHLNAEQLKEIEFYFPPLSLQQLFIEIVSKTEALKEKQKQSELELENLFQGLMQRAFKGELVLN